MAKQKNRVTIHAFDKHSSAVFSKAFLIDKTLKEEYKEFQTIVPFCRWFFDTETDSPMTKSDEKILMECELL